MATTRAGTVKARDVLLALAIVVGFIIFQIGTDWRALGGGVELLLAILGLAVVLGAAATLIYDHRAAGGRLDVAPEAVVREPGWAHFLFHDTRSAPLWLAVRLYVGYAWLEAGYHKLAGKGWMDGGSALAGYWKNAIAVNAQTGKGPITYGWYRDFLQYMLDQQWYTWFAKLIVCGELLVGVGIILGGLVGIAAFCGALMNMSFMLAGSASTNPVLFTLAILLILGWKVAGYWGLDRFILPALGAPWSPGRAFRREASPGSAATA
jgi:thiosulfate dehydrogenase (quinone) large subunit